MTGAPKAFAYCRLSFDDPNHRTSSVEDQELFARVFAEQQGYDLVQSFSDNGITGATMERPGLLACLEALGSSDVKTLIIEDVDRLSRDQEHLAYMKKQFRVMGVTLLSLAARGEIDNITLAFKGIIGEQQRERISFMTRRGLRGKAKRGGATGGKTLGYARQVVGRDSSGHESDQLVIVPAEALLVRRIFQLYAEGNTLKGVCKVLNNEGIPSPRARETGKYNAGIWNPTTLSGDPSMGEGILNNELYIGRRIFNRRTWVEVPNDKRGFRRVPRLNPEALWDVSEHPDLQIIDLELWSRVKQRQAEARERQQKQFKKTGNKLAGAKRPALLLSGLVRCGACGEDFVSAGGRWRCKAASRGKCDNSSISANELETRALAGLRDRLLLPDLVQSFARHLQEELDIQQRDAHGRRGTLETKLADVQRRSAKIMQRIEEDDEAPRALTTRLKELESEELVISQELANLPERTVIRLPANYEALYIRAIAELHEHLANNEAQASREAIRALIERVVVHVGDSRGDKVRRISLYGDLYAMLAFARSAGGGNSGSGESRTSLVAGAGFEPATFRL